MCLWPLVLINLGCQLDTPGEGYSQMKSCLYQIVLWANMFSPIMRGTIPKQVDLDCIGTVTEYEPRRKPVSNVPS